MPVTRSLLPFANRRRALTRHPGTAGVPACELWRVPPPHPTPAELRPETPQQIRLSGEGVVWGAVICHRFSAGDLSPSNDPAAPDTLAPYRRREPWMPHSHSIPRVFGGDQSLREGGDKSPHSKYRNQHPSIFAAPTPSTPKPT
ncbi:hypothetical protein LBMAG56_20390 [Verrucomicrobiota bacterium]|nr:hypothetical protein LBMAG56_20390 [Verrucomicrobiota bacterium]